MPANSRVPRLFALGLLAAATAGPSVAGAQAPAGPPGPPPGAGTDLPSPPGTALAVVPPGTPAAIPSGATGPGLLSDATVALNRGTRAFKIAFACQGNGTVSVSAPGATKSTLAAAKYRCDGGRASVRLHVSTKIAKRLAARRVVAASATVNQAAKSSKLSFLLRAGGSRPAAKGFWTDGHLQCTDSAWAPRAYLIEPDFTTATQTPISTRGWVAWHTAAGGWHWLGVNGENASRWDTWTATATGIVQFHPHGVAAPVPWSWGPISVPVGHGIYAVGVYEIIYWVGGRPDYQWQYVNAGSTGAAAAKGGNLYCAY